MKVIYDLFNVPTPSVAPEEKCSSKRKRTFSGIMVMNPKRKNTTSGGNCQKMGYFEVAGASHRMDWFDDIFRDYGDEPEKKKIQLPEEIVKKMGYFEVAGASHRMDWFDDIFRDYGDEPEKKKIQLPEEIVKKWDILKWLEPPTEWTGLMTFSGIMVMNPKRKKYNFRRKL